MGKSRPETGAGRPPNSCRIPASQGLRDVTPRANAQELRALSAMGHADTPRARQGGSTMRRLAKQAKSSESYCPISCHLGNVGQNWFTLTGHRKGGAHEWPDSPSPIPGSVWLDEQKQAPAVREFVRLGAGLRLPNFGVCKVVAGHGSRWEAARDCNIPPPWFSIPPNLPRNPFGWQCTASA